MGRVKDEPLFQLLHDYLKKYLPDQKYASSNTVKAYRTALNQFFKYVVQEKSIPLSEITFPVLDYDMVNAYLDWLVSEKKCSPATRNHRLTCIRSFFAYAASRSTEYMAYQAALSKNPKQKAGKIPVEYMSEEAVQTILKQPDTSTRQGIRDQFFMVLLYDTAARVQEMLDLKVCDIRPGKTPTATLLGKGSKVRTVPLMPETMEHFQNYLNVYHEGEGRYSTQPLFYIVQHGTRNPMSDDNVRKFLKKYGDLARKICPEVPENIHPHLWRHSRSMHLYQHGMDLTLLSQWLGHANLETTLIYAYADTEQKRRAIEKSMGRKVTGGIDIPRFTVSDEDTIKRLYGLK